MRSWIEKLASVQFGLSLFRTDCGGFKCLKTWDSDKPRKCQVADQFMQCVYQRIDIQVSQGKLRSLIILSLLFVRFAPLTDEDQPYYIVCVIL